ncbi:MAG: heavy metal translocating P-type ATPase, partial [Firmicutes bacterium HGW-Firmicutes-3]
MSRTNNIKQVGFKVDGMSCSSCSNNIEKKLNALKGIVSANISIATEKGHVEYDDHIIDIKTILFAIDNLGYKAMLDEEKNTQKVTLRVKGMSCTACATNIEKSLHTVEGVVSANVNFAVEKVTIEYDPIKVRLIDFQKKVSSLGYELNLDEDENDGIDEDEIKMNKAKKTMIISSVFTGAIMGLMMIHM